MYIIFIDKAIDRHLTHTDFMKKYDFDYHIFEKMDEENLHNLKADILIVHQRNKFEYNYISVNENIGGRIRIFYSGGRHTNTFYEPNDHYIKHEDLYKNLEIIINEIK